MLIKFCTENSTYQVDTENKLVRRITGVDAPTFETGKDGVWKAYQQLSPLVVGQPLKIYWAEPVAYGSTTTSTVLTITPED